MSLPSNLHFQQIFPNILITFITTINLFENSSFIETSRLLTFHIYFPIFNFTAFQFHLPTNGALTFSHVPQHTFNFHIHSLHRGSPHYNTNTFFCFPGSLCISMLS